MLPISFNKIFFRFPLSHLINEVGGYSIGVGWTIYWIYSIYSISDSGEGVKFYSGDSSFTNFNCLDSYLGNFIYYFFGF